MSVTTQIQQNKTNRNNNFLRQHLLFPFSLQTVTTFHSHHCRQFLHRPPPPLEIFSSFPMKTHLKQPQPPTCSACSASMEPRMTRRSASQIPWVSCTRTSLGDLSASTYRSSSEWSASQFGCFWCCHVARRRSNGWGRSNGGGGRR